MFRQNNYFIRLYKQSRFLFVIVCSFLLLSIVFNFFIKKELTPIYRWDIYSGAIPPQETYIFFEVRYNDDQLLSFPHTWQEPEKLFLTNTLTFFIQVKDNGNKDLMKDYYLNWFDRHKFFNAVFGSVKPFVDTTEIIEFPAWYKRYLTQHVKQKIDSILIFEKNIKFEKDGGVNEISSKLIYKIL